jgi:hypothetical protein
MSRGVEKKRSICCAKVFDQKPTLTKTPGALAAPQLPRACYSWNPHTMLTTQHILLFFVVTRGVMMEFGRVENNSSAAQRSAAHTHLPRVCTPKPRLLLLLLSLDQNAILDTVTLYNSP